MPGFSGVKVKKSDRVGEEVWKIPKVFHHNDTALKGEGPFHFGEKGGPLDFVPHFMERQESEDEIRITIGERNLRS